MAKPISAPTRTFDETLHPNEHHLLNSNQSALQGGSPGPLTLINDENVSDSSSSSFYANSTADVSKISLKSNPVTNEVSRANSQADLTDTKVHRRHHIKNFTRHISMTPFSSDRRAGTPRSSVGFFKSVLGSESDLSSPKMKPASQKLTDAQRNKDFTVKVRDAHIRYLERWATSLQLSKHTKITNILDKSREKLMIMIDLYDEVIEGKPLEDLDHDKLDSVGYWSSRALIYLSGVKTLVSEHVLVDFSNYQLKPQDKMRILKLNDDYAGIQGAWLLALDNPTTEVYNYSTSPILYTINNTDKKARIGPTNFHIVQGSSFKEFPFSRNSFTFGLAYSLYLTLKEDEWIPALSEYYRVLQPKSHLNLLLTDFTVVNCQNELFNEFSRKIRALLQSKGIDPFPCKKIQSRLREVGFEHVRYTFISLEKGNRSNIGNIMEFVIEHFEFLLFTRLAQMNLDEEELVLFKQLKLQYHRDIKNNQSQVDFGSAYIMFVLAQKP